MKTALELLDIAPRGQVKRMQIVSRAIAKGEWGDAVFALRNAVQESVGTFADDCEELAEYCQQQIKR